MDYLQRGGIDIFVLYNAIGQKIGEEKYKNKIDYIGISSQIKLRYDFNILTPYMSIGLGFYHLMSNRSEKHALLNDNEIKNGLKISNLVVNFNFGLLRQIKNVSLSIEYMLPNDIIPLFDNGLAKITQNTHIINFGLKYNLQNR